MTGLGIVLELGKDVESVQKMGGGHLDLAVSSHATL